MPEDIQEMRIRDTLIEFFKIPPYRHREHPDTIRDRENPKIAGLIPAYTGPVHKPWCVSLPVIEPDAETFKQAVVAKLKHHINKAEEKLGTPIDFRVGDDRHHQLVIDASQDGWSQVRDIVFAAYGMKVPKAVRPERGRPRNLIEALEP